MRGKKKIPTLYAQKELTKSCVVLRRSTMSSAGALERAHLRAAAAALSTEARIAEREFVSEARSHLKRERMMDASYWLTPEAALAEAEMGRAGAGAEAAAAHAGPRAAAAAAPAGAASSSCGPSTGDAASSGSGGGGGGSSAEKAARAAREEGAALSRLLEASRARPGSLGEKVVVGVDVAFFDAR